jgi:hypothetical protein
MHRLEVKNVLQRTGRMGKADKFGALISRRSAYRAIADDFISVFEGRVPLILALLIETGKATLDPIEKTTDCLPKAGGQK